MARFEIIDAALLDTDAVPTGIVSFGPGLATHLEAQNLIVTNPTAADAREVGKELLRVVDDLYGKQKTSLLGALMLGSLTAGEIAGASGIEYDLVVARLQSLERSGVVNRDSSGDFGLYAISSNLKE